MKRTTTKALAIALFASLAFSGVVSAKDHPSHSPKGGNQGPAVTHGSGPTTPSLKVKGNASHPGATFRVLALVHADVDLRPATVDAIVHFASGDVPAVLTRSGSGGAYHAFIPVPASEPAGVVLIDATATVDGTVLTATGQGKIVIGDETEAPEAAPLVEPSPTCVPAQTETPDATANQDESETPDATDNQDESETPDATDNDDQSESADPSDGTDESDSDETSETADPCAPTVTTTFTLSAEMMAQVIAFVESLFS
jgi:hypothetical protein